MCKGFFDDLAYLICGIMVHMELVEKALTITLTLKIESRSLLVTTTVSGFCDNPHISSWFWSPLKL